jgi:hypothetical protein
MQEVLYYKQDNSSDPMMSLPASNLVVGCSVHGPVGLVRHYTQIYMWIVPHTDSFLTCADPCFMIRFKASCAPYINASAIITMSYLSNY